MASMEIHVCILSLFTVVRTQKLIHSILSLDENKDD